MDFAIARTLSSGNSKPLAVSSLLMAAEMVFSTHPIHS